MEVRRGGWQRRRPTTETQRHRERQGDGDGRRRWEGVTLPPFPPGAPPSRIAGGAQTARSTAGGRQGTMGKGQRQHTGTGTQNTGHRMAADGNGLAVASRPGRSRNSAATGQANVDNDRLDPCGIGTGEGAPRSQERSRAGKPAPRQRHTSTRGTVHAARPQRAPWYSPLTARPASRCRRSPEACRLLRS